MTRLLLVRHGENPANLTMEFSCRLIDHPLTEKGRLQARQTAEFLASTPVDEIWTSPLRRARETADAIAEFQSAPVFVEETLREMDVGDLESLPPDQAWPLYADVMRQWLSGNTEHAFPGGESRQSLCQRFRQTLGRLVLARPDRTLVIVGHGGLFTHGVIDVCNIEDQVVFLGQENYNCSISVVEACSGDRGPEFFLVDWASVRHLSGPAAQVTDSVPEAVRAKNLTPLSSPESS